MSTAASTAASTPAEIAGRLAAIVEDGFAHFNSELNGFYAHPATDANTIATFLQRAWQYNMLFWGYEHVTRSLGIADAAQIDRVTQIHSIVGGQAQQIQNLLNQWRAAPPPPAYRPPTAGQSAIEDANRYTQQVMAEVTAKRQQMYAYTNRLRELTQNGIPYMQAELLAKQETGYRG